MVNEREPKVTTDEVRGGETTGRVRYVLLGSIVLIVVIFGILLAMYR